MESNPSLCRFFSSIFLLYLKFFFFFLARNVHIQSDIDECGFRKTSSWPASFASSPFGRGRDGGMERVEDGGMEEISQRVIQCIHKLSLDTKSLPFVVELHFFRNRVDFSKWKKLKPKVCNTHNFSVTWKEKAQSVVMQHCFCQASLFSFFSFFWTFYCTQTDVSPHFSRLNVCHWIVLSPQCVAPATRCHPSLNTTVNSPSFDDTVLLFFVLKSLGSDDQRARHCRISEVGTFTCITHYTSRYVFFSNGSLNIFF